MASNENRLNPNRPPRNRTELGKSRASVGFSNPIREPPQTDAVEYFFSVALQADDLRVQLDLWDSARTELERLQGFVEGRLRALEIQLRLPHGGR